jgi:hypothetical protein
MYNARAKSSRGKGFRGAVWQGKIASDFSEKSFVDDFPPFAVTVLLACGSELL